MYAWSRTASSLHSYSVLSFSSSGYFENDLMFAQAFVESCLVKGTFSFLYC